MAADRALIEELLGGDPLMTPAEAEEALGMTQAQLEYRAAAGEIPSIQPGGFSGERRYRTSVIRRLAAERSTTT